MTCNVFDGTLNLAFYSIQLIVRCAKDAVYRQRLSHDFFLMEVAYSGSFFMRNVCNSSI